MSYIDNGEEVPFGANDIRLDFKEWGIVLIICLVFYFAFPFLVKMNLKGGFPVDYRVPEKNARNYWLYQQASEEAQKQGRTLIIGDSVIWGEFVCPSESLSQCLNNESGKELFANGGVNGSHPLALQGLAKYYASISNQKVIIHLNFLWMSSPGRDLSVDTETNRAFNHKLLVPQFDNRLKAYSANFSERLGNSIHNNSTFFRALTHIREVAWEGQDLHSWSFENPRVLPWEKMDWQIAQPSRDLRHAQKGQVNDWQTRGMKQQNFKWMKAEDSLQWQAFQEMIKILKSQGNDIFVIVGPFNEHTLKPVCQKSYYQLKKAALAWLKGQNINHLHFSLLDTKLYGDTSHPLAQGYKIMAKELWSNKKFQDWL